MKLYHMLYVNSGCEMYMSIKSETYIKYELYFYAILKKHKSLLSVLQKTKPLLFILALKSIRLWLVLPIM